MKQNIALIIRDYGFWMKSFFIKFLYEVKTMYGTKKVTKIINSDFADLKIREISYVDEGDNSEVYLVNNLYIFRLPKHERASTSLKKEIKILPKIKNSLNLSIPDFTFIGKPSRIFPMYYAGYKKIEGKALSKKTFNNLSTQEKDKTAQQIAVFLKKLHSFPIKDNEKEYLKVKDFKAKCKSDYHGAKEKIYPILTSAERKSLDKIFKEYLNNSYNFKYKPTLIHNDLSYDHIFFDTKENRICGIIDFGNITIGDPDYDFTLIAYYYGEKFIKRIIKYYEHQNEKRLMEKLKLFQICKSTRRIIDGLKYKNVKKYKDSIRFLKSQLEAR